MLASIMYASRAWSGLGRNRLSPVALAVAAPRRPNWFIVLVARASASLALSLLPVTTVASP